MFSISNSENKKKKYTILKLRVSWVDNCNNTFRSVWDIDLDLITLYSEKGAILPLDKLDRTIEIFQYYKATVHGRIGWDLESRSNKESMSMNSLKKNKRLFDGGCLVLLKFQSYYRTLLK